MIEASLSSPAMERGCASTGRSFSENASVAVAKEHFIFAATATVATDIAATGAGRTYDANSADKRIVNTSRVLKANSTTVTVNVPTAIFGFRSA